MATTSPTRIDDEVFESARIVGSVMNRSASQQVTHWARIGRELESSSTLSIREISAVLDGQGAYDDLTSEAQAVIRAGWSELAEARISSLDLAQVFATQGRSYVELDDDGNVVEHGT